LIRFNNLRIKAKMTKPEHNSFLITLLEDALPREVVSTAQVGWTVRQSNRLQDLEEAMAAKTITEDTAAIKRRSSKRHRSPTTLSELVPRTWIARSGPNSTLEKILVLIGAHQQLPAPRKLRHHHTGQTTRPWRLPTIVSPPMPREASLEKPVNSTAAKDGASTVASEDTWQTMLATKKRTRSTVANVT